MDDADISQPRIDAELALRIEAGRAGERLPFIGKCHYCEKPLDEPDDPKAPKPVFCDPDCRDDWDHMQARIAANGGKP